MASEGDSMEMTNRDAKPSEPPDKSPAVAQGTQKEDDTTDRPPTPPKRDYGSSQRESSMVSEPVKKRSKIGSFPRPLVIFKPESSSVTMTCLKNIVILFNLLIWLFGAVLTGVGVWIKVDREFWDIQTGLDMRQFSNAAYILIAAGVIIMLVGFVGCYGAYSESLCLLIVYAVIVVLIILLEIAVIAIVWTASKNNEVKEEIKSKAKKAMQEMAKDENQLYFLDLIQAKLECCGIEGPDDYKEERTIPPSCNSAVTTYPYEQGCLQAVVKYFEGKAGILGGVSIAVFLLQLAALILTCVLVCGIKNAATNAMF